MPCNYKSFVTMNSESRPEKYRMIVQHIPKQLKLSERKVLQFSGFHPNVGNIFVVFVSSTLKI